MFILVGHLNIPLKVENMGESVCVLLKISKGIQSFQNISCQEFMASKKILWLARDFEDRAPRPKNGVCSFLHLDSTCAIAKPWG